MTNIKNKLLSIAVCLLLLVSMFGLGISFNQTSSVPVKAETISVETENDFWLVPGARIRYADDGVTGISYRFQIKDSVYQSNKTDYDAVKYGILIAPKEYDLSYENVFGNDAIYDWAEKDVNGDYVYSGSKTRIVNLEATSLKADYAVVNGEKTAVRYFNGNMVNIKAANLTREFQAKGYFAYSTDGGVSYTYVDTLVGDENNVRSIVYVAQMAIQDESADAPTASQKELLETTYITETVLQTVTSYVTEHYTRIDGNDVLLGSNLTENVKIGETVNAVENSFENYSYDAESEYNVLSGTVLANGRLVLKRYYRGTNCSIVINPGNVVVDEFFPEDAFGTKTYSYGQIISVDGITWDGYTLIGWVKSNGDIVVGSFEVTGDETLTAIWVKDAFATRWGEWTPIS